MADAEPDVPVTRRIAPVWKFAANRSRAAVRLGAEARKWRKAAAVAQAGWDHEKAARLDAEARERRASDCLDFLVAGRFDKIVKGPA